MAAAVALVVTTAAVTTFVVRTVTDDGAGTSEEAQGNARAETSPDRPPESEPAVGADPVTRDAPGTGEEPPVLQAGGGGRGDTPGSAAGPDGAPTGAETDAVPLPDGTRFRVNGVERDADRTPGAALPDADTTITRVDVEACAGADGLRTGPLSWEGILDDGSSTPPLVDGGDHPMIGLKPGGCVRGRIDLPVPRRARLAAVRSVDEAGAETWRSGDLRRAEVAGPVQPLVPLEPPELADLGERVMLHAGETATVIGVADHPDPDVAEGRRRVAVEVEQCAEALPVAVSAPAWFGVTASNWVGGVVDGGDLRSIVLEPGDCTAGTVVFDLPDDELRHVVMTGFLFDEAARWSVD